MLFVKFVEKLLLLLRLLLMLDMLNFATELMLFLCMPFNCVLKVKSEEAPIGDKWLVLTSLSKLLLLIRWDYDDFWLS